MISRIRTKTGRTLVVLMLRFTQAAFINSIVKRFLKVLPSPLTHGWPVSVRNKEATEQAAGGKWKSTTFPIESESETFYSAAIEENLVKNRTS